MSSTKSNQLNSSMPSEITTAIHLPIPHALNDLLSTTVLTEPQVAGLQSFLQLPFNAQPETIIECIEIALETFKGAIPIEETAVQRAKKFDIYDEFFNVGRTTEQSGQTFIHGLLQTYANALKNMSNSDHHMTVIEIPLLRVAVESTLQLFDLGETA